MNACAAKPASPSQRHRNPLQHGVQQRASPCAQCNLFAGVSPSAFAGALAVPDSAQHHNLHPFNYRDPYIAFKAGPSGDIATSAFALANQDKAKKVKGKVVASGYYTWYQAEPE